MRADELATLGESFLDDVAEVLGAWARLSSRLEMDTIGVADDAHRLVAFGELSAPGAPRASWTRLCVAGASGRRC